MRFNILFYSFSVTAGQKADDNERPFAMEHRVRLSMFSRCERCSNMYMIYKVRSYSVDCERCPKVFIIYKV